MHGALPSWQPGLPTVTGAIVVEPRPVYDLRGHKVRMCAQVLVERRHTSSESEEPAGATAGANGDAAHAYGNGNHSDAHATLRVAQEGGNASSGAEGRSERVSALIQSALADDRSSQAVRAPPATHAKRPLVAHGAAA